MVLTQLLSQLMKKVQQPRVIAEVFAGILLSPSALGRIPNFTNYFFPEISKPYLFLIADIGLVLFLFLVGLEIEAGAVCKTVSLSASIALGGIILPFGLGSALAVPLYNHFGDPSVEFTHFFLFIGIAFSITAFPVLCRILTEWEWIGAFLVGLIIPREGGLAIALAEKFEDIVSILLLPLYFTTSGLSTDFGLLNDKLTWTFTLGIIILAWAGKFGGGLLAARIAGLQLREAAIIGTLLSCKGLIELIVLNVGLSAGILNKRVFSMFVLEALTLTFLTTPVVVALYPPECRKKCLLDAPSANNDNDVERISVPLCLSNVQWKSHVVVILDGMDELSSIMNFMELLKYGATLRKSVYQENSFKQCSCSKSGRAISLSVKALRLIELSERSSGVMKSSAIDRLVATDPLLKTFKTYCDISGISVSASLSIVPLEGFASKVAEDTTNGHFSELLLIPWSGAHLHNVGGEMSPVNKHIKGMDIFTRHVTLSGSHLHYLRDAFSECKTDLVLLMDRGVVFNEYQNGQHFIFPFFGGKHDRLALRLMLQLCAKDGTTATVFRIPTSRAIPREQTSTSTKTVTMIDDEERSSSEQITPPVSLEIEQKADEDLWRQFTSKTNVCLYMQEALGRIEFLEKEKTIALTEVLHLIHLEIEKAIVDHSKRPFIVLSREGDYGKNTNTSDGGSEGYEHSITASITPGIISTLGILPSAVFTSTDDRTGLMIIQSKPEFGPDTLS
ncbi:hypothetical protein Clacol_008169 [Clathrus columnatus]|uniref:Cation/H+ exchanger transmembrane domain-containing protein n=1 Tax=Clathrus columnatus TaxID=1419009 RepID=A0AAV5AJI2_9AGAM|nr:hypothetical protein Clacol_008169 [Clathrus columnatus]